MANPTISTKPTGFSNQQELEAMLLEGMDSGKPIEVNAEFWAKLHAELASQRLAARKAS